MTDPAQRATQRPNIYDVAKSAGVSHMTVSRVLNGRDNIRASTRERVLLAIEQMHYAPSSIARALATQRAMRIGVLVDAPQQLGPTRTLRAVERAARDAGYALSTFSVSDSDELDFDTGIVDLVTQGVDALCVIAPRVSSLQLMRQRPVGLPTVVVKPDRDPRMLTAAVDQDAGASLAVQHLIDLGHRRIAHLAGPLDWYDALARENGWRRTVLRAGLTPGALLIGDWTADCGHRIGRSAELAGHTAVFAANDQMALGLVRGLAERGLRVPHDVSVIGFDDLPDSGHFLPPLTTVRQDFAALGARAIELLIAAMRDDGAPRHVTIQPQLVVRSSTAPAPEFTEGLVQCDR